FLDGELPARQMLELQAHLDVCSECAVVVAFSEAVRRGTQQVVQRDALVSDAFQARLTQTLAEEARLERAEQRAARKRRLLLNWLPRGGFVALSAATVALAWVRFSDMSSTAQMDGMGLHAQLQPEDLIDRLIDYHSAPPKPLVTDAELVPELERDVGVRIAAPSLAKFGAHLQGGTVVRVRGDQPAAVLRYRTADNHIFSVYFYNPSRLPLHAGLVPRMFHEEPLYEGYRRGYTIVAELRRGVGYAITTDLDEPLSAELVRAISNSAVTH
ncbi:MAG TPA: zf-HC2 domain-containing protein, partial [Polyangiaceae bacterium]|nr:zf-HC2 domain-containing protein [Polyangiaceae bacterium]